MKMNSAFSRVLRKAVRNFFNFFFFSPDVFLSFLARKTVRCGINGKIFIKTSDPKEQLEGHWQYLLLISAS